MFMKNCRRKNTANGEINRVGSMIPSKVSMRCRCFMRTKLGSRVKIDGIIIAPRKMAKMVSLPRHFRRAKAYAAMAQLNVCTTVIIVATTTELRR